MGSLDRPDTALRVLPYHALPANGGDGTYVPHGISIPPHYLLRVSMGTSGAGDAAADADASQPERSGSSNSGGSGSGLGHHLPGAGGGHQHGRAPRAPLGGEAAGMSGVSSKAALAALTESVGQAITLALSQVRSDGDPLWEVMSLLVQAREMVEAHRTYDPSTHMDLLVAQRAALQEDGAICANLRQFDQMVSLPNGGAARIWFGNGAPTPLSEEKRPHDSDAASSAPSASAGTATTPAAPAGDDAGGC